MLFCYCSVLETPSVLLKTTQQRARFFRSEPARRMGSPILRTVRSSPTRIAGGAPFGSKDAPITSTLSNRYFGIGQYVRLMDSALLIWLNRVSNPERQRLTKVAMSRAGSRPRKAEMDLHPC